MSPRRSPPRRAAPPAAPAPRAGPAARPPPARGPDRARALWGAARRQPPVRRHAATRWPHQRPRGYAPRREPPRHERGAGMGGTGPRASHATPSTTRVPPSSDVESSGRAGTSAGSIQGPGTGSGSGATTGGAAVGGASTGGSAMSGSSIGGSSRSGDAGSRPPDETGSGGGALLGVGRRGESDGPPSGRAYEPSERSGRAAAVAVREEHVRRGGRDALRRGARRARVYPVPGLHRVSVPGGPDVPPRGR
jgi:hypothetical protein